jgi:hypothetical protein
MITYTDKSQSEEIEPHPDLILYFQETQKFSGKLPEDYNEGDEFYNIVSNIEQNIFLLDRLNERSLLKENNNMIDCGIGLGFTLFDFYLQSLSLNQNFTFTGIEKQKVYVEYLKKDISKHLQDMSDKKAKYVSKFKEQLQVGIDYYKQLVPKITDQSEVYRKKMLFEIEEIEQQLQQLKLVVNQGV